MMKSAQNEKFQLKKLQVDLQIIVLYNCSSELAKITPSHKNIIILDKKLLKIKIKYMNTYNIYK
jgi:hypothetical protein